MLVKGDVKYEFQCMKQCVILYYSVRRANSLCSSHQKLVRARWEGSTSNLRRHVKKCDDQSLPAGQGQITDFAAGSTYTREKLRLLLVRWISRRFRPYAIVADPELIEIFEMLYARVEIPSPSTLSRDVREVYDITSVKVGEFLKVCSS